jgi:hypothetical protein
MADNEAMHPYTEGARLQDKPVEFGWLLVVEPLNT